MNIAAPAAIPATGITGKPSVCDADGGLGGVGADPAGYAGSAGSAGPAGVAADGRG